MVVRKAVVLSARLFSIGRRDRAGVQKTVADKGNSALGPLDTSFIFVSEYGAVID